MYILESSLYQRYQNILTIASFITVSASPPIVLGGFSLSHTVVILAHMKYRVPYATSALLCISPQDACVGEELHMYICKFTGSAHVHVISH